MNDEIPDSQNDPATNALELTVSEISGQLKRMVESNFGHVRVRGEITGYRGPHSSGHMYFALKDERARIEAVVWKGVAGRLKHHPEEGLEVIASGKLTTYPGSSKYQIVIDNIEPAGAGALMALLNERKKKLEAEGLFSAERKQLLPYMPKVIGVITSPTGAVIRDILHRIADRFALHVIVWPVRVQGETCGAEVLAAVNGFNALAEGGRIAKPDILIIARGGGSIEDLWSFNDEALVRGVAASNIPVISAVGHETDWTLVDLAADVRAPTPTGAAEMAVPVKADLEAHVATLKARLVSGLSRKLDGSRADLRAGARGMPTADTLFAGFRRSLDEASGRLANGLTAATQAKLIDLVNLAGRLQPNLLTPLVENKKQMLVYADSRMNQALKAFSESASNRVTQAKRLLDSYSYTNILKRGFVVVRSQAGDIITLAKDMAADALHELEFADAKVSVVATKAAQVLKKPEKPAKLKTATSKNPNDQGDLF